MERGEHAALNGKFDPVVTVRAKEPKMAVLAERRKGANGANMCPRMPRAAAARFYGPKAAGNR
jgi:hypothetical protein